MAKRTVVWVQGGGVILFVSAIVAVLVSSSLRHKLEAQTAVALAAPAPLEKPPEGQTYIGTKECSACHFDQLLDWRQTKHAKAFDILPAKYKTDAACLSCHTTGHGQETGFTTLKATPNLVGASCESCHGPGSEHGKIAKSFGTKKLTAEEDAYVRSTIFKIDPNNVCVNCHLTRAHKKHPPYTK